MTVALRPEIEFTRVGLSLPDDLSFEDWQDYGERLFAMERGVMWAIGDWWRYGDQRYGERAAQALDSRYAFGTLANAGYVAGSIETSRRREVLTFSHHQEVASLPTHEQDYWLDEAERGEWTRNELRARIKRGMTNDEPEEEQIGKSATWDDFAAVMDSLEAFLTNDASAIATSVPPRRMATTAKRLRKLGTGLGRIAWILEGPEGSSGNSNLSD